MYEERKQGLSSVATRTYSWREFFPNKNSPQYHQVIIIIIIIVFIRVNYINHILQRTYTHNIYLQTHTHIYI